MTFQERLKRVRDALTVLSVNVYHYWRPKMAAPFVVWQEDSGRTFEADNRTEEMIAAGTLDIYSKTEYDPLFDSVMDALTDAGVAWSLESIQYEDETGLIHYELGWQV